MNNYQVSGASWEKVKSEKDLYICPGVVVNVEMLDKNIQSITIMAQDHTFKIVHSSYSSGLQVYKLENKEKTVTKYTVVAKKDGDSLECTRDTLDAAEDKRYDLERDGWTAEIVEIDEVVKIDIISGKETNNIPF